MILELEKDELRFPYKLVPKDDKITKRSMLRVIAGIYDPIGFICPAVLECKSVDTGVSGRRRLDGDDDGCFGCC